MLDAAEEGCDLHKHPEAAVTLRKSEKPLDLEENVNFSKHDDYYLYSLSDNDLTDLMT